MGAWNLKEFKTLCLNSGFDEALFYTNSLAVKWNAAIYHKGKIQQKIKEINSTSFLEKAPAYDYEIAFELDALMLTLNSVWDILAQLLNERFVKTDSSEVSFSKFSNPKECYYRLIPPEIQQILEPIRGNALYRTIKTFANVSKHRHAPQGEINMDVSKKPANVSYIIEYKKGKWHKLTPNEAFRCMGFVGKSVDQVGAKIHKLMK